MATVKLDLIQGAATTNSFGVVTELTRVAHVSGLTADTASMITAMGSVDSIDTSIKIPQIGDAHPDNDGEGERNGIHLFLENISVDGSSGPTNIILNLTYRFQYHALSLVSASSGLESVLTNKYPDHYPETGVNNGVPKGPGKEILLGPHPAFSDSSMLAADGEKLKVQGGELNAPVPRASITMMNVLSGTEHGLLAHGTNWSNRANSKQFIVDGDKGCWKISAISMVPLVVQWRTKGIPMISRMRYFYDMQHKEEGWNPITVVGTDPQSGGRHHRCHEHQRPGQPNFRQTDDEAVSRSAAAGCRAHFGHGARTDLS